VHTPAPCASLRPSAARWRIGVDDFESLLKQLSRGRVLYVVVGGFAAMAHGISLLTQDVDICCPFTSGNLLRLQDSLTRMHPVHRMTPGKVPLVLTKENARTLKNLYLETTLGQIDCISEVAGVGGWKEVLKKSIRVKLSWGHCRILNIDGLIESKLAMNRPRDREAVKQLRAIKELQKK
jgi:hypothetical protein